MFKRILIGVIIFTLIFPLEGAYVYSAASLVSPQTLNLPDVSLSSTNKSSVILKGLQYSVNYPFQFKFLIKSDKGSNDKPSIEEIDELIKYFLASLTLPPQEMWVNLSVYEKNRIIPENLGKTSMGISLLSQDYFLKKLTASLIVPENEVGRKFWNKIYAKTREELGALEIPMNVFEKVWIVPAQAKIYEYKEGLFIVDSHLKVLLEPDYLALAKSQELPARDSKFFNASKAEDKIAKLSAEVMKEVVIPEIEREVNQGETFANLRQIFQAVILAAWVKKGQRKNWLVRSYANQGKMFGIATEKGQEVKDIYKRYVNDFRKGNFNSVQEEYNPRTQAISVKKFFSGGILFEDQAFFQHSSKEETKRAIAPDDIYLTADCSMNIAGAASKNKGRKSGKPKSSKKKELKGFDPGRRMALNLVIGAVTIATAGYGINWLWRLLFPKPKGKSLDNKLSSPPNPQLSSSAPPKPIRAKPISRLRWEKSGADSIKFFIPVKENQEETAREYILPLSEDMHPVIAEMFDKFLQDNPPEHIMLEFMAKLNEVLDYYEKEKRNIDMYAEMYYLEYVFNYFLHRPGRKKYIAIYNVDWDNYNLKDKFILHRIEDDWVDFDGNWICEIVAADPIQRKLRKISGGGGFTPFVGSFFSAVYRDQIRNDAENIYNNIRKDKDYVLASLEIEGKSQEYVTAVVRRRSTLHEGDHALRHKTSFWEKMKNFDPLAKGDQFKKQLAVIKLIRESQNKLIILNEILAYLKTIYLVQEPFLELDIFFKGAKSRHAFSWSLLAFYFEADDFKDLLRNIENKEYDPRTILEKLLKVSDKQKEEIMEKREIFIKRVKEAQGSQREEVVKEIKNRALVVYNTLRILWNEKTDELLGLNAQDGRDQSSFNLPREITPGGIDLGLDDKALEKGNDEQEALIALENALGTTVPEVLGITPALNQVFPVENIYRLLGLN